MKVTVYGQITIEATTLTVEVNSDKRAKKFKSELKKRMKSGWIYKTTVIESVESAMRKKEEAERLGSPFRNPEPALSAEEHPEIKVLLEKQMKAHWADWIHKPLPALSGKTPLLAMKTKDGREMVQALITQFERETTERAVPGVSLSIFEEIREKLNLERMG